MNIKPKIGVDSIKLGMTRVQVEATWGKPDFIYDFIPLEDRPNEIWEVWEYSDGTELNFDSDENFLLGSINLYSPDALFENIRLIGLSERELKLKFPKIQLDDDFELSGKDYLLSDQEVSFWVVDGKIDNITISPEYDESGNIPIWPTSI